MIGKKNTIKISKNSATLSKDISLFRTDKNIDLYFEIVNNDYKFDKNDLDNNTEVTKAPYSQVILYKDDEINHKFDAQPTDNGNVVLTIEETLIDEAIEVGDYDFQIILLDENKQSQASLPIIRNQFHVCEPLMATSTNTDTLIGNVVLGATIIPASEIKDAFDENGNYIREVHVDGEPLTAQKVNKFENALAGNTRDLKNIKNQLGSEELTTTAKNIKAAINEHDSQIKDKDNLTNKRIEVGNDKNDIHGVADFANYAGQGTSDIRDIMIKIHNYTDSDVAWLDNVGENNTILRLNNSRNPVRREDKNDTYVGEGKYIVCGKHKEDGSKYIIMFELDSNGNMMWDSSRNLPTEFINSKSNETDVPAFIFKTPSGRHDKIATFQTSVDNEEVLSIGVHGSGSLAEIDLGEKMTSGLVFNLREGAPLMSGINGNVRNIPNVRVGSYLPDNIAPEFVGQIFINPALASVGTTPSVYIGFGTEVGNWVALN